jgi:hypothetical protein
VAQLLRHFGYELARQGKHDTWHGFRAGRSRSAQVPRDRASLALKTLYSILAQAGITKQEARDFWS